MTSARRSGLDLIQAGRQQVQQDKGQRVERLVAVDREYGAVATLGQVEHVSSFSASALLCSLSREGLGAVIRVGAFLQRHGRLQMGALFSNSCTVKTSQNSKMDI
ncbi:hypothetical protein WAF00_16630 [Mameliella alba]|uniref:hypothetical protein n=1 Tax=Mameliella alba TaxID=561184 RepID=UPI002094B561|nr:hypothetical protein [Mameliella alba]